MNIPAQKLLKKIEDQLGQAKAAPTDGHLREKIYAIKTLCDLILEDSQEVQPNLVAQEVVPKQSSKIATVNQQPRMKMDEEANGDSLFDF